MIAAHSNFFGGMEWGVCNHYFNSCTEQNGCLIYSQTGGPRYTRFRADINLLNNAENIDIQWNPCATFKTFAEYYPVEKDNEMDVGFGIRVLSVCIAYSPGWCESLWVKSVNEKRLGCTNE